VWLAEYYPALNVGESILPQKQMVPKEQSKSYGYPLKSKGACNMLNLNGKVKSLDLLKRRTPFAEVGQHYAKK
jgi:hypothetical protein